MKNLLKCGKCTNIFNTGQRMPIELPCTAKMCEFRNACSSCVKTYILEKRNQDGSYPCCFSEKHTIPLDFVFNTDDLIKTQIENREKLTIKCRTHDNKYVEDYCHHCNELICYRCTPFHKKLIKCQQGKPSFTPEGFKNYLVFVRPKLEDISKQINQTLNIFNHALCCDEEFYAEQITQEVNKTFKLLQHRLSKSESINMLHLNYEKYYSSITPDPQSKTNYIQEEESKQEGGNDQLDQKALISRLRTLDLSQKYFNDKIKDFSRNQQEFIKQVTQERLIQSQELQDLKDSMHGKLDQSIFDIIQKQEATNSDINSKIESSNQQNLQLDSQFNAFKSLTDQSMKQQEQQIVNLDISLNEKSNSLEQVQAQSNTNLKDIIEKLEQKLNKKNDIESISDANQMFSVLQEAHQLVSKKLFRKLVDEEVKNKQNSLLKDHISNYEEKSFDLQYKGSRDGFTASKFHELCDEKGPTVCFILSEYGQVFGGYTSFPWRSYHQSYQIDNEAFIFSLSQRSIHFKKMMIKYGGIFLDKKKMCAFGKSDDLTIEDFCDKNKNNVSHLGEYYILPEGIQFESKKAEKYLAGQKHFKVLEIEVYSFKKD
eukprot:403346855